MSRSLGAILGTLGAAALVATGIGAAAGLALFGTTAGISVAGVGLGTLLTVSTALTAVGTLVGSAAPAGKPETTVGSIKAALAPRVDAFGEMRLYPAAVCYETAPDGSTVDVGAFCEGPAGAIVATYLNDDRVTVAGGIVQPLADKSYQGGNVRMGWTLGAAVETAFAAVVAAIPDRWTGQHRGDGVVSAYLIKRPEKDKRYLETYPQGDNVEMSLVGQWKRVFDWRDPAQSPYDPSTWRYSDNPVLCLVWYLMARRSFGWNTRLAPQIGLLTTAANDCDSPIPLATGGSEPRYRCALAYKLTDAPAGIIAAFLAAFDGWYDTNEAGEVVIYSGRYYEPTVRLGPDQITAFTVPYGIPAEDAVNEITVQYVSAEHDWKTVDAQSWRDEDAISRSGREPNTTDLGAQIPSFSQGRRLAKRKMARARRAPITISTTMAGESAIGQRYVWVDLTEAGATFYRGPVEIVTAPERDTQTGGVVFQCVPVDPNLDAWNPATEEGYGASVSVRVPPEPVPAPIITSAVPVTLTATGDGTVTGTGARIQVDVTGPGGDGLTWYARWRLHDGAWNEQAYPDEDPTEGVRLLTGFVPLGQPIDVQAEYRTVDGRLSGWSETVVVMSEGSAADPAPIAASIIATSKPSADVAIQATADGTISISAHSRIYSDRTVPVDAGTVAGLTPDTYYSIFYDDPGREGGAVVYQASASPDDAALSAAHPYRHYVGAAAVPAEGQPPTTGGGATGPGGIGPQPVTDR